jgi:hypothetical protein
LYGRYGAVGVTLRWTVFLHTKKNILRSLLPEYAAAALAGRCREQNPVQNSPPLLGYDGALVRVWLAH